jgi:hypothetical protein
MRDKNLFLILTSLEGIRKKDGLEGKGRLYLKCRNYCGLPAIIAGAP